MNARELITELAGTVCQCGAKKQARQTFCRRCYFSLTPAQRQALYNPVGHGYEAAYANAIDSLRGESAQVQAADDARSAPAGRSRQIEEWTDRGFGE